MRSKKAIINIFTSLIMQVTTILCGFIIPRLIIGTYGSDVNGLIASITQFLGYITLLEAGVGPVIKATLYKPIAKKDTSQIEKILKASEHFFRNIARVFLIYLIGLCIFFPIIMSGQFDTFFTVSLVLIIAISIFSEYFFGMTYRLYLEAEQKTYIISVIQVITYIISTILIVVLIYFKIDIRIVKLIGALIFTLRPIIQKVYVKKMYHLDVKKVEEKYKLEQKWDGLAQHIAAVVHNNTDIAVLTIFSNIKNVSIYSIYLLIVNGIKNLVLSFASGIDASFGNMIAKGEMEHFKKNFKTYELFYFTIVTILFSSTMILIVPFVKVYTLGITDANYVEPLFGTLMVIAEFIWAIRQPYNELIKATGHFKETQIGAWVEAITNLVISTILVIKFGLVGVAIGTIISIAIRTCEFIVHTSKYILKRKIWYSFKRILIIVLQTIVLYLIVEILPPVKDINYIEWIWYAIKVVIISSSVVITTNLLIYKNEFKELLNLIKNIIVGGKK